MRWVRIARKDFQDAVQSRALWALVGVFVVLSVGSSFAYTEAPMLFGEPEGPTFQGLVLFTVGLLGLFVPIAAIVVCYKALAGERESGSIKLLLSLPTTRTDVLLGKVVGRTGVLTAGIGLGFVLGIGLGAALIGSFSITMALALAVVTLLFVAVYASIVVGLSAVTGSTAKATTYALGFFVIAELLWDVIPLGILYVVEGFAMPTEIPDWGFALMQLGPSTAYFSGVVALLPDVGAEAVANQGVDPANGGESIFAAPEFGFFVLLFWLVAPLVLGYVRFNAADM